MASSSNGVDRRDAGPRQAEPIERIDVRELRYLLACRRRYAEVPQIEAQVAQLERQRDGILGALDSYGTHLAEAYGLDATRDRIEDDGRIVRAEAPTVGVPMSVLEPAPVPSNGRHGE